MNSKLLDEFRSLFEGKKYLHRVSTQGDWVAQFLFEDLFELGKATKLLARARVRDVVVNTANKTRGIAARRGDGSLGELVPGAQPRDVEGFHLGRGQIANVQVGAETKILAKAMIKQIDRVINDLEKQAGHFRRQGRGAITVALVGVNHADSCVGYEGDRSFPAQVSPSREAPEAIRRIKERAAPAFDESIILRFKATNEDPFPFMWVDEEATRLDYASALTRISRLYDERF